MNKIWQNQKSPAASGDFPIASGVVPHHAVAKEIIENFFSSIAAREQPQVVVILGPDHFHITELSGKTFVSVRQDTRQLNGLDVDTQLLRSLAGQHLAFNSPGLSSDHAVTALLPYVAKYFPHSRVLPLLVSSSASAADMEALMQNLHVHAPVQTLVVASVDFSHYLPPPAADFHDVKSIAAVMDREENDFRNLEVDSWQAVYGARYFAQVRKNFSPTLMGRGKSSDYLKTGSSEEVTSYVSAVFSAAADRPEIERGKTVLLVGNIILGQGVTALVEKNNPHYPFQKISQFLRGIDVVVGNLEGPPVLGQPMAAALASAKFNLLSLANDHASDVGMEKLAAPREILSGANIKTVGDPDPCAGASIFQKEGVTFFAFNAMNSAGCVSEDLVRAARQSHPKNFLIVSMHWENVFPQELAHRIIEAGADVVVGHHPQAVQKIDVYGGKPIFYALGNFVTDQDFPTPTREGMGIGIEIYDRAVRYRLFPLQSIASQPALMPQAAAKIFLARLAQKSGVKLRSAIQNGIIEVER
ncbi:MAG: AmmeMemoRadiSam system protein B [Patescibacteria group bacterium]|nr:AmmeMemoRadiSam system protein B [Patescibacteria group bacterium]